MDWKVSNALNRDVERQHLNKILAEIRSSIDSVSSTTSGTNTVTNTITTKYAISNFVLTLTGDITGSATVDGTGDVTLITALSGDVGIEEAPIDNQFYRRYNGGWQAEGDDSSGTSFPAVMARISIGF